MICDVVDSKGQSCYRARSVNCLRVMRVPPSHRRTTQIEAAALLATSIEQDSRWDYRFQSTGKVWMHEAPLIECRAENQVRDSAVGAKFGTAVRARTDWLG